MERLAYYDIPIHFKSNHERFWSYTYKHGLSVFINVTQWSYIHFWISEIIFYMVFIVKRVEYCRFDSSTANWHMNTSTIMYWWSTCCAVGFYPKNVCVCGQCGCLIVGATCTSGRTVCIPKLNSPIRNINTVIYDRSHSEVCCYLSWLRNRLWSLYMQMLQHNL